MFNDIGWTKNANSNVCVSNSRKVNDYAKEFVLKKKKSGVERAITSQEGTGTSKPLKWLSNPHRVVIPYSEAKVCSAEEHWNESKNETLFTSQRTQKILS